MSNVARVLELFIRDYPLGCLWRLYYNNMHKMLVISAIRTQKSSIYS